MSAMSLQTRLAKTIKFYQISLGSLRKRLGNISEMDVAAKIIEEINSSQQNQFELKCTTFDPENGASEDGKVLGFQPSFYIRWTKVLDEFQAAYNISVEEGGVPVREQILFYNRPGYLLCITVLTNWELLQPYTCKQFPVLIAKLAEDQVGTGWRLIPSDKQLYKLTAFKDKLTQNIMLKTGNGFVQFNLDKKFFYDGVPEMLNYLIEECKLGNGE